MMNSESSNYITKTITINTCTGMEELTSEQISIYPNPANDHITISIDNSIDHATIKLIDILGKEIMSSNIAQSSSQLNLSGISNGIYSINVTDALNHSFTKLIVVNH